MLKQTINQLSARIDELFLFSQRITRQEHARLQLDQLRSHNQKIASHGQIEFLHHIQIAKILVSDSRDRNVVDVHLLLANQVKQQIKRTFELAQGDLQLVAIAVWNE